VSQRRGVLDRPGDVNVGTQCTNAVVRVRMVVFPPLTHDRVLSCRTETNYVLTGSMTVQVYTFPKISPGDTVLIR
jgi:hypothetical protein